MDNNMEIVHCVTLSRRRTVDPNGRGEEIDRGNLMQMHVLPTNHWKLPAAQPWRVMSSEIVARKHWGTSDKENRPPCQQEALSQVVPDKHFLDNISMGPLRTPMKQPKHKSIPFDSNMTKNCQSLFSRMRESQPKKVDFQPDPSYSVRRIVRNSGLLQYDKKEQNRAFDTASSSGCNRRPLSPVPEEDMMMPRLQLSSSPDQSYASEESPGVGANQNSKENNPIDDDPIPLYSVFNSCSLSFSNRADQMNVPPSPLSPPSSPLSLHDNVSEDTGAFKGQVSPGFPMMPSEGSVNRNVPFYQQHSQSQLFDTIVFKKTVETEVVEYDYSEGEPMSPSTSTTASRRMPSKRSRSRAKQLNSQRSKRMKHRETQSGYDPSSETEDSG